MSNPLIPYNLTTFCLSPYQTEGMIQASGFERNYCSLPGTSLIRRYGTIEIVPKSPAFVFGEGVVKPFIQSSASFGRYIWSNLKGIVLKIDHALSRIFNFIPSVRAAEQDFDQNEKTENSEYDSTIRNEHQEIPKLMNTDKIEGYQKQDISRESSEGKDPITPLTDAELSEISSQVLSRFDKYKAENPFSDPIRLMIAKLGLFAEEIAVKEREKNTAQKGEENEFLSREIANLNGVITDLHRQMADQMGEEKEFLSREITNLNGVITDLHRQMADQMGEENEFLSREITNLNGVITDLHRQMADEILRNKMPEIKPKNKA